LLVCFAGGFRVSLVLFLLLGRSFFFLCFTVGVVGVAWFFFSLLL